MCESEIQSNPNRHKTPVSLKEVKGCITNLVQYNRVLEYSFCDSQIKLLPSIKTWKREPPQQWILIKPLKTKLYWFLNIQQSVASVTQGKKDTVLENPSSSKRRNSHMHSLPDQAGVKVLTYDRWVLPTNRKGTVT